jgi:hypothetical protein
MVKRSILICDIIRDIMNKQKLGKLKRRLNQLRGRRGNIRSRELVKLAQALGRKRSKRGDEPTYVSVRLPYSLPISIPDHPKGMNPYVAGNILDALEKDILELEEMLSD